ncbi:MAG: dihydroneopterin aldolase [Bacteroidaceae bacterium]|nr:dihydroneopterin aldolase [Bacteroidaceae bacterium]
MSVINLSIKRLRLYAHHGVLPQERRIGANFYLTINACVEADKAAMERDELAGTVSYADVVRVAAEEMQTASRLLEHVACRIARRLLDDFGRIREVSVFIEKENPPLRAQADSIGVGLTLAR